MRDPYAVLGVKKNAGQEEIKAAWRSLAKAVHPDQNHDDPKATIRFTEAGRAYDLLRDPDRRSRYDRQQREAELRRMEEMKKRQTERKAAGEAPKVSGEEAEDMIARIFGVDARGPAAEAKPTAQEKTKAPPRPEPQPASEAKADARAEPAGAMDEPDGEDDTGQRAAAPASTLISAIIRTIRGARAKSEKAPDFIADLTVTVEDILTKARPTVETPEGQALKVPLGAGTTEGQVIRLKEAGHRIEGMKRGDVVLTVRVAPGRFRIEGFDLHVALPISLEEAVLGTQALVEGPLERFDVTVPAWSGSDKVIRIEGEGLMREDGTRGDLVAEIRLLLSEKPDERVIDLVRSAREGLYL